MFENIDPYIVALAFVLMGGIAAIIVPYLGKVYDEGAPFKVAYFIPLCFTVIIGAIGLIPTPVPELNSQILANFFVTGYGLQAIGNFATTRVIKA